jgi:IstB-like ATP binding protein
VSELVAERIRANAERLRLAHLTEASAALVARAETAQMGYLEFLDLALEEEVGVREGRRFRNALKLSGLPHHKSLDEFDFAFQPELDARRVKDLAALAFVKAKANVCLLGPPGVGKTMLAVGLSIAACQAGFSVYFTTLDGLPRIPGSTHRRGPRRLRGARITAEHRALTRRGKEYSHDVRMGFGRLGVLAADDAGDAGLLGRARRSGGLGGSRIRP